MDISTNICLLLLKQFQSDYEAEFAALKQLHMQRVAGSGKWGDGRRRAEHLRHKTTTPEWALQSLEKQLAQYRDQLTKHLSQAAAFAIKIEHAEREASAVRWLMNERERNRSSKPSTGLYAPAKRVIDELYEQHEITQGHFSALDELSIAELAVWLRERHSMAIGQNPAEQTGTGQT